jgi:hypothetical protein
MKTTRLISALAVVGSVACVAVPSASAATGDGESASSANWSGYVAGGNSSGGQTQFSDASGSWVEPSADCSAGQGYSAFWVGIGGAGQGSGALEQVGTEADCDASGSSSHFAWYELVPAAPVRLDVKISPGDHVTGKVTVNGNNVTMSLSDSTTGQSDSKTLPMTNPSPDTSTAEWIAEAPSQCDGGGNCQPLPLTDFGKVGFTNASATANGHTGSISDSAWSATPVQLNGGASNDGFVSDTGSAGATPSSLSSDGSAFSVAWSSGSAQTSTASDGGSSGYSSGGASGYPGGDSGYGYPGGDSGYGSPGDGYGDGSGYSSSAGNGWGYPDGAADGYSIYW